MGVMGWGAAKDLRIKELERGSFAGLKIGRFESWEIAGHPTPWVFVSVAYKRVRFSVSRLFATVAGKFVSVADKGLMGSGRWREGNVFGWADLGEI